MRYILEITQSVANQNLHKQILDVLFLQKKLISLNADMEVLEVWSPGPQLSMNQCERPIFRLLYTTRAFVFVYFYFRTYLYFCIFRLHCTTWVPQMVITLTKTKGGGKSRKKPRWNREFFLLNLLLNFAGQNMQDEKMGTARMDLMFLCLFPCFFLIFNMVYWLSFLWIYPS